MSPARVEQLWKLVKLYRLKITSETFLSFTKEEKLFVLRFSQLHNDLRHIRQLVTTAGNGTQTLAGIEGQIALHQFLFAVRLWCGVLREAKRIYDAGWNQSDWASRWRSSLSQEEIKAGKDFSRYFSDRNLIWDVRDNFAFHYDNEVIAKELEHVDLRDGYHFVSSEDNLNIFYASAETFRTVALLRMVNAELKEGLGKLYDEIAVVHANFMTFSEAVLARIVEAANVRSEEFFSASVVDSDMVQPVIFVDEDAIRKQQNKAR